MKSRNKNRLQNDGRDGRKFSNFKCKLKIKRIIELIHSFDMLEQSTEVDVLSRGFNRNRPTAGCQEIEGNLN